MLHCEVARFRFVEPFPLDTTSVVWHCWKLET